LATPYYSDPFCTIYHGDCEEILPTLGRFDLLLTDPPYGIGIAKNPVRQAHESESWDNQRVKLELIKSTIEACDEAIIWGGNYYALPPSRKFLVWDKHQPENFSLAMCEQAWCSRDGNAKLYSKRVVGYEKLHPTQKPVDLLRWCLRQSQDAKTVLDPFMGSGTTLVAAKLDGRHAVGIEISEKYCEIAANRLRQGVLPFSVPPCLRGSSSPLGPSPSPLAPDHRLQTPVPQ